MDLQHSGKHDSFWHILKSSVTIYECLGSQFFLIVIGIQSGPGAFDELRSVMIFSTKLEVTGKSCSLRLILEEKAD